MLSVSLAALISPPSLFVSRSVSLNVSLTLSEQGEDFELGGGIPDDAEAAAVADLLAAVEVGDLSPSFSLSLSLCLSFSTISFCLCRSFRLSVYVSLSQPLVLYRFVFFESRRRSGGRTISLT